MILLTRLAGPRFALNQDLIERADCTPDTVITLVDGSKYVVTESLADVVALVREFRSSILAEAQRLERYGPPRALRPAEQDQPPAPVLHLHRGTP